MIDTVGWAVAVVMAVAAFIVWRDIRSQRDRAEKARRDADGRAAELQLALDELESSSERRLRTAEDNARHAVRGLAEALMPVEDTLQRALQAGGDTEAYRQGIELVQKQLEGAFVEGGLKPLAPDVGASFEPQTQSCVDQAPGDDEGELVVETVVRRGWSLHDRLLRAADVIVVRRAPEPSLMPEPSVADVEVDSGAPET